jgi:hypothetical protein
MSSFVREAGAAVVLGNTYAFVAVCWDGRADFLCKT